MKKEDIRKKLIEFGIKEEDISFNYLGYISLTNVEVNKPILIKNNISYQHYVKDDYLFINKVGTYRWKV